MSASDLPSLLFAAIETEFGIIVSTTDPSALRQRLYTIRKMDPTFWPLAFIISPEASNSELWIVKKEK